MSIKSDCDGDNINLFDLEHKSNDFDFIFQRPYEHDEKSISDNQNSGESSTGSNESTSLEYIRNLVVPHDVKPDVPEEFKPNNLMRFKCVDDAVEMYKIYVEKAGFDAYLNTIRKDGDIIIHRYVVCHRNGSGPMKSVADKRKGTFKVTKCQSKIIIKRIKSTDDYKIDKFFEMHDHPLLDSMHLKKSRKLSFSDKEFIIRASTIKLGATKAYKLKAALNGGYEYVIGKLNDYKNFKRNAGASISFGDAQIIVNKMKDLKANYPNYPFDYKCDD